MILDLVSGNMLPRQTGKTTCAPGYLLWYAMFVPDSTILIVLIKHTGSSEIMQRVRFAYEGVPNHIRAGVVEYNKGSVQFHNGSRIVATTQQKTLVGVCRSINILRRVCICAKQNSPRILDHIITLATGGKCIITSTPKQ